MAGTGLMDSHTIYFAAYTYSLTHSPPHGHTRRPRAVLFAAPGAAVLGLLLGLQAEPPYARAEGGKGRRSDARPYAAKMPAAARARGGASAYANTPPQPWRPGGRVTAANAPLTSYPSS